MKCLAAVLSISSVLGAQAWATVPDGHLTTEAASRTRIPGLGHSGSKQIVIGAALLQHLLGRDISAISLRRDASWAAPFAGGTSDLVVRIGPAANSPRDVVPEFAANLPNGLELHSGVITVPASGAVTAPIAWASPFIVEVPFTSPYRYSGGPLAIEITGTNLNPSTYWWAVDAIEDDVGGSVTFEGHGCGPRGGPNGQTGGVAESSLVLGGTALFDFFGQAGANALLLIGASTHPTPINLAFLDAPGCELRVDFFAIVPRPVLPTGLPGFDDMAYARIPLPAQPALLNGQLVAQWLEFGAVVTSSQTMHFQIAGRMPNLDMVTLLRFSDGSVEIRPRQAPIIGFLAN